MRLKKLKILIFLSLIGSMFFASSHALQVDFPNSPIRLVVAYSPGGATDFQARIVSMLEGLANISDSLW